MLVEIIERMPLSVLGAHYIMSRITQSYSAPVKGVSVQLKSERMVVIYCKLYR